MPKKNNNNNNNKKRIKFFGPKAILADVREMLTNGNMDDSGWIPYLFD